MAAHVKVKGIGLKGTGSRAYDGPPPVPAAAGGGHMRPEMAAYVKNREQRPVSQIRIADDDNNLVVLIG
jgi:hypothetical protein